MMVAFVAIYFMVHQLALGTHDNKSADTTSIAVKVAASIPVGTNAARVHRMLPKGINAGEMKYLEDDQVVGNVVGLTGKVRGYVKFSGGPNASPLRCEVSSIVLYIGPAARLKSGDVLTHRQAVKELNRALTVKPQTTTLTGPYTAVYGKVTQWRHTKLGNVVLYEHWYGNGLTLQFNVR